MSMKYINVAFKAYATTTLYMCDIDDIKVGDFVVVPSWNSELTGRVVSFSTGKQFSLKKPQAVLRKATPKEINEVADVFGIAKNPDYIDEDDEDESFLTNSGYGTKELKKILKKYDKPADGGKVDKGPEKAAPQAGGKVDKGPEKAAPQAKDDSTEMGDKDAAPGYWRYVAIAILALYFLKDFIFSE